MLLALLACALMACSMLPRKWTRQTRFGSDDLNVDNPVVKIHAIHQIVDRKDLETIPKLIDLMADDDTSVRDNAYWGVTQLAGRDRPTPETPVFHHYDSPELRAEIVSGWKRWDELRRAAQPEAQK